MAQHIRICELELNDESNVIRKMGMGFSTTVRNSVGKAIGQLNSLKKRYGLNFHKNRYFEKTGLFVGRKRIVKLPDEYVFNVNNPEDYVAINMGLFKASQKEVYGGVFTMEIHYNFIDNTAILYMVA